MPRNIKIRVYVLIAFLVLSALAFCFVIIDSIDSAGDEHIYKSTDGAFELEYHGSGEYMLNQDILLKREDTGFKEELIHIFGWVIQPKGIVVLSSLILSFLLFAKYMPPPYVMRRCFFKDKSPFIYPDLLPPDDNITGVISWREWRDSHKQGILKSTKAGMEWGNSQIVANEIPHRDSWYGIHAFRLGVEAEHETALFGTYISGLVSQSGIIIGHGDNVLRSEKCKVLCLITRKKSLESLLRKRYDCPVYVVPDEAKAINTFTISDSGIYWLSHNNRVIKDYLQEIF